MSNGVLLRDAAGVAADHRNDKSSLVNGTCKRSRHQGMDCTKGKRKAKRHQKEDGGGDSVMN